jgi:hypothetical protein
MMNELLSNMPEWVGNWLFLWIPLIASVLAYGYMTQKIADGVVWKIVLSVVGAALGLFMWFLYVLFISWMQGGRF